MTATVLARPAEAGAPSRSTRGLLSGSAMVAAAAAVAAAANYASNIILVRDLDGGAFADAALIVSGVLLFSAVALAFQLLSVRALASGDLAAARRVRRSAHLWGLGIGVTIAAAAPWTAPALSMSSVRPMLAIAVAVPLLIDLAVRRARLQASGSFGRLALSFGLEGVVRLVVTWAAIAGGAGALGAALAVALSLVVAGLPTLGGRHLPVASTTTARRVQVAPTVLALSAQLMITSGDMWIVAAMLPGRVAEYAAAVLVGRIVIVAASSLTTVAFPELVAGHSDRTDVVRTAVIATAALGGLLTLGAVVLSQPLARLLVDAPAVAPLLGPYALATTLYTMANVRCIADVAVGRMRAPLRLLALGTVQILALIVAAPHGLEWVVWVQVVVMAAAVVLVPGPRRQSQPSLGLAPAAA